MVVCARTRQHAAYLAGKRHWHPRIHKHIGQGSITQLRRSLPRGGNPPCRYLPVKHGCDESPPLLCALDLLRNPMTRPPDFARLHGRPGAAGTEAQQHARTSEELPGTPPASADRSATSISVAPAAPAGSSTTRRASAPPHPVARSPLESRLALCCIPRLSATRTRSAWEDVDLQLGSRLDGEAPLSAAQPRAAPDRSRGSERGRFASFGTPSCMRWYWRWAAGELHRWADEQTCVAFSRGCYTMKVGSFHPARKTH
jgi:hypothetical protein